MTFKTATFELPVPPSVNHYYVRGYRGAVGISKKGKLYRDAVVAALKPLGISFGRKNVGIEIIFCGAHVVENTMRDLDNMLKCLLDSLTHAKIWVDDRQIDDLRIVRGQPSENKIGFVSITVREL